MAAAVAESKLEAMRRMRSTQHLLGRRLVPGTAGIDQSHSQGQDQLGSQPCQHYHCLCPQALLQRYQALLLQFLLFCGRSVQSSALPLQLLLLELLLQLLLLLIMMTFLRTSTAQDPHGGRVFDILPKGCRHSEGRDCTQKARAPHGNHGVFSNLAKGSDWALCTRRQETLSRTEGMAASRGPRQPRLCSGYSRDSGGNSETHLVLLRVEHVVLFIFNLIQPATKLAKSRECECL